MYCSFHDLLTSPFVVRTTLPCHLQRRLELTMQPYTSIETLHPKSPATIHFLQIGYSRARFGAPHTMTHHSPSTPSSAIQFSSIQPTFVDLPNDISDSPTSLSAISRELKRRYLPESPKRRKTHPIRLHIYSIVLHNRPIPGLFHTGIVLFDSEFAFCNGAGIVSHEPIEGAYGVKFLSSEVIGHLSYEDEHDLYDILDKMRNEHEFTAHSYHLLLKNCNHFTQQFARELMQDPNFALPTWVNQAAQFGSYFSCLIPQAWCRPTIAIEPPASVQKHQQHDTTDDSSSSDEVFAVKELPTRKPVANSKDTGATWSLGSVLQSWRLRLQSRHQLLDEGSRI